MEKNLILNTNTTQCTNMYQVNRLQYRNDDAPENLIRYITRTRQDEDRKHELLVWGTPSGYKYHQPIEHLIQEFKFIQQHYHTKNSLMCHYVLYPSASIIQSLNDNIYPLADCAVECCRYLFNLGFQSCFAIHLPFNRVPHIHFAINTASFRGPQKLRQYPTEIKKTIAVPLSTLVEQCGYHPMSFDDFLEEIPAPNNAF